MLTWLEISKSNLLFNIRQLRKVIGGKSQLMAVVKANAYGHGIREVAFLIKSKVDWFGVASLEEALELRSFNIRNPILVLSYYEPELQKLKQAIKQNTSFALYSLEQAKALNQAAKSAGKTAKLHLKIDTGTSRLGIFPRKLPDFISQLKKCPHIYLEGLFSHFADSEQNDLYTKKQLTIFERASAIAKTFSPKIITHLACSAAGVLHPASRKDIVRVGIMIYGLRPSKKTLLSPNTDHYVGRHVQLKPVLSWKTKIIQTKELPKDTYVGYGLSFRTKRRTKLAVLPVGYADGYDRKLSNKGEVLVSGRRASVIGRVCMNITMIDATNLPAKVGDEVTLIGKQGKDTIAAEDLAAKIGTINYEIVTRINWSLPRILI